MTKSSTEKEEQTFSSQVRSFDFSGEAIDTSLRKLLAEVTLPKEAQQIDRAMEDFARHYYECNPTLVDNPDIVYAVAFSILLLHTDAHNKNVKQKMNKDTFIMRTKIIEGGERIPPEILDVMYDNIVASEFTYVDNKQVQVRSTSWFSKLTYTETPNMQSIALINDLCDKLEQAMPAESTFNYKRTLKPIPTKEIHLSLLKATSITLSGVKSKHSSSHNTICVTKAGLMDRKYDLIQGGKKAPARGWRPFGVILSGSQIIFFADIPTFQSYLFSTKRNNSFPSLSSNLSLSNNFPIPSVSSSTTTQQQLRPVQILSLAQSVCIYDESYTKYPHVFRLIIGDGQQFLLRTEDMDDWMLKINHAATLKTTGIKVRSQDRLERSQKLKERVREITCQINEQVKLLDHDLQLRRNLMVLVPVQKSTKDRILLFADTVGKRIKSRRIELQRLQCYRDFLECEFNWQPAHRSITPSSLHISTSDTTSSDLENDDFNSLKSHEEEEEPPQPSSFTFPKSFVESLLSFQSSNEKAHRRSQSNPITPIAEKMQKKRQRSGSETSSYQADVDDDDDLSVVIVDPSEESLEDI